MTPTTSARPSTRVRLAGLGLLPLVPILGCGGGEAAAEDTTPPAGRGALEPISVAVAPVLRGDVRSSYVTSATLRAEARATVTSRTRGVIEELFVEEGDAVEAEQVLAQLEDDEQRLALTRAESLLEIKEREYERQTGLNQQKIISDNELELIRRERAEASLDVELAQLNLERTSIRAPFDATVVRRWLDVGAAVSDGTEIFDVADLDPLYADVSVPERHVGRLASEQEVMLTVDGLEAQVEARIERLAPVVDAATGTVKVTVAVAVEPTVNLRPGAFVEVQIVTEVHHDVLVVPRRALIAEGRRWLLFRPAADGKTVEAIEVELGFEEGERVEVSAAGERSVAPGERVVVLGASALSDAAPIRILDGEDSSAAKDVVSESGQGGGN